MMLITIMTVGNNVLLMFSSRLISTWLSFLMTLITIKTVRNNVLLMFSSSGSQGKVYA